MKLFLIFAMLFSLQGFGHVRQYHLRHLSHDCALEDFKASLDSVMSDMSFYLKDHENKQEVLIEVLRETTEHDYSSCGRYSGGELGSEKHLKWKEKRDAALREAYIKHDIKPIPKEPYRAFMTEWRKRFADSIAEILPAK